jgi:hypothetical protein
MRDYDPLSNPSGELIGRSLPQMAIGQNHKIEDV